MQPKVYLAGPISGLTYEGSTSWREYASRQLAEWGIGAASPMRAKGFLDDGKTITAYGSVDGRNPLATTRAIVARDHFDVRNVDLVLMNLLGAQKVSLGTMVEVGWATAYSKPIVLVMEPGNLHEHPFLDGLVGFHVADLDSGLSIVHAILEPYVSPQEAFPLHKLEFQGNEVHY